MNTADAMSTLCIPSRAILAAPWHMHSEEYREKFLATDQIIFYDGSWANKIAGAWKAANHPNPNCEAALFVKSLQTTDAAPFASDPWNKFKRGDRVRRVNSVDGYTDLKQYQKGHEFTVLDVHPIHVLSEDKCVHHMDDLELITAAIDLKPPVMRSQWAGNKGPELIHQLPNVTSSLQHPSRLTVLEKALREWIVHCDARQWRNVDLAHAIDAYFTATKR